MMFENRKLLTLVNLFSLVFFVATLVSVRSHSFLTRIDSWISLHISSLRMDWLTPWVKAVTDMNDFVGVAIFSFITILLFWRKEWYSDIGLFVMATLGSVGLFSGVKFLVERARPDTAILEIGGYSFPSGHTTMATAMAFACYFILKGKTDSKLLHTILFWAAFGWTVLIATTRIYLGVHWFSDVLGGFSLGLFWITLLRLVWKRVP